MASFLSKPTLLFLLFNFLRLLSVVGLCLVFASEIVTINSDVKGMRAWEREKAQPAPPPSTTASVQLVRREVAATALPALATAADAFPLDSLSPTSEPLTRPTGAAAQRPSRMVRSHRRAVDSNEHLPSHRHHRREPHWSGSSVFSPSNTSSSSTSAATAPGPTATNRPLGLIDANATAAAEPSCAYIGETSIPKGTGGALFSTLERIFASFILLLMLFSELAPPFPPLSRPARWIAQFWSSFFPPFSVEYGVGVLGALEIFVSCQVLSHATTSWVQVSSWFLFIVGLLNLLAGLAFGARLKVIRSIVSDSTTPSALRQLRLQRATEKQPGQQPGVTAVAYAEPDYNPPTVTKTSGGLPPLDAEKSALAAAAGSEEEGFEADHNVDDKGRGRASVSARFASASLLPASFRPALTADSTAAAGEPKRSTKKGKGGATTTTTTTTRSRNGLNGIVISAPIRPASNVLGSGSGVAGVPPPPPPPVYRRGDQE